MTMSAEDLCDVCAGSGKPESGKPCICGGTGKGCDEKAGLRRRAFELGNEIIQLKEEVKKLHDGHGYRSGLGPCVCKWCGPKKESKNVFCLDHRKVMVDGVCPACSV